MKNAVSNARRACGFFLAAALSISPAAQAAGRASSGAPIAAPLRASASPLNVPRLAPIAPPAAPILSVPSPALNRSPLDQLRQTADPARPPEAAARRFDGTARLSSSDDGAASTPAANTPSGLAPPTSPRADPPTPPEPGRSGWFQRARQTIHPRTKAEKALHHGMLAGTIVGGLIPALWNSAPAHSIALTLPAALLLFPAIYVAALFSYRLVQSRRPTARAGARAGPGKLAAAAGLALGIFFGTAIPAYYHAPLVERVETVISPYERVRWVRGGAIEQETIARLSANSVGRHLLDHLRDRGGEIRLPDFFVSAQKHSLASYSHVLNAVYIDEGQLFERGWSVEDFLASPEKQRQYVREELGTVAHELSHADQARRSIFEPGQFHEAMEYEYEAHLMKHLLLHEELKKNPNAAISGLDGYKSILADLDAHLKSLDSSPSYARNGHIRWPRYERFIATLRPDWQAHRVEGYALLARRYSADPVTSAVYSAMAAAVAEKNNLPLPPKVPTAP